MRRQTNYYLGLDIGTDSVGYAATNEQYEFIKHHGEPMWGVHLFDEASLNSNRRTQRSTRRRLERIKQRIKLLQEIFAAQIAEKDEFFYRRIRESALWREDANEPYCLFNDPEYNDADYHRQYPTIHHLIYALMENDAPHDVRLVYLACAWLVAHRGHFYSDVSKDNLADVLSIESSYESLMDCFENPPWECDPEDFGKVLKKKIGVNAKYSELCTMLFGSKKAPKTEYTEDTPYYSTEHIIKLLCGAKVSLKNLLAIDEDGDSMSFSLGDDEESLAEKYAATGEGAELIIRLKALYDWAILADILDESVLPLFYFS